MTQHCVMDCNLLLFYITYFVFPSSLLWKCTLDLERNISSQIKIKKFLVILFMIIFLICIGYVCFESIWFFPWNLFEKLLKTFDMLHNFWIFRFCFCLGLKNWKKLYVICFRFVGTLWFLCTLWAITWFLWKKVGRPLQIKSSISWIWSWSSHAFIFTCEFSYLLEHNY